MNNIRSHNNTLNEPITAIVIGLIKLGVFLAAVDWSKFGGWDEKKATENLVKSWITNNNLWLYPANNVGGPWPLKTGAGKLGTMDKDSLRYFIEWRIPVYTKTLLGTDWSGSKQRVKNRYFIAVDGLKVVAIEMFEKNFGPYINSGLYAEEVAKFPIGSTDVTKSASWKIKRLAPLIDENKPKNDNGEGKLSQGNEETFSQGNEDELKSSGEIPNTKPQDNAPKTANLNLLGYAAATGILLVFAKKMFTKNKTKAGLNAPVEVSL
jgi:hypothetical protein